VNRQHRSLAGLAATALLIGLATVACARGGGATGQPQAPAAATIAAGATATDTANVDVAVATDTTATPGTSTGSAPAVKSPVGGAAATADPLDTDLQKLNQLLQGVKDSLSGANGGGE
jgi:hypothetical protein